MIEDWWEANVKPGRNFSVHFVALLVKGLATAHSCGPCEEPDTGQVFILNHFTIPSWYIMFSSVNSTCHSQETLI